MSGTARDSHHRAARSRSPASRAAVSSSKRRHEDGDHAGDSDRHVRSRRDSRERRHHSTSDRHNNSSRRNDHDRTHDRRRHHHHHRHGDSRSKTTTAAAAAAVSTTITTAPKELPYSARSLSYKTDLDQFRPILARYLDVQKQRDMYAMDEREVRGRWKSFVSKWNSSELASGWYDPDVFATAVLEDRAAMEEMRAAGDGDGDGGNGSGSLDRPARSPVVVEKSEGRRGRQLDRLDAHNSPGQSHDTRLSPGSASSGPDHDNAGDDSDDSDYGPTLPTSNTMTTTNRSSHSKHTATLPNLQDLALRRETAAEARMQDRHDSTAKLRADRKADRAMQKERLEDLVPRADPGSHARKMEKKREVNDKLRSFRDRSPGLAAGVDDRELMGGDDGGGPGDLAELKRQKEVEQRRKTEREIRREEEARAREEEREDRLKMYRDREDRTMEVLKEIARQRFG